MSILKVISGGQTGADRAGLDAANALGLPTGGTAPAQYWTTRGPDPSLKELGLEELNIGGADGYRKRTAMNVADSDFTIAIASNYNSPGERLTRSTCAKFKKRIIAIPFSDADDLDEWKVAIEPVILEVLAEIKHRSLTQDVVTLNVAGNSEKTSPRCYLFARAICDAIFYRALHE